jgi:hypothetical protein
MIRTAVIASGLAGLGLFAAAPASAQSGTPTTTFSCSPCIILDEFLMVPGQTAQNFAAVPGQTLNNFAGLPGQAIGNVVGLPGEAAGRVAALPGQAIGNITSLPGQAIGNITSLPGHAFDNIADLAGINDRKLDGEVDGVDTGEDPNDNDLG